MTPAENGAISGMRDDVGVLAERIDTMNRTLASIERLITTQEGRIAALEGERIAREAVAAAGTRIDLEREQKWRWQLTAAVAIFGTFGSLALGLYSVLHQV